MIMISKLWNFLLKNPCLVFILIYLNNSIGMNLWLEKGSGKQSDGFFTFLISLKEESVIFMSFCLLIGLMVSFFSIYYMRSEEVAVFNLLILIFIGLMITLTSGGNCFTMFIGWEGVGVMSFMLILWFSSRGKASSGSKKAVLFNRFSDFFFLLLILFEVGEGVSLFYLDTGVVSFFSSNQALILISAFFFSSAGKSAQFVFHPWLTSAMEGPTPVSSLLHSSTMVVAGVFLLIKLQPFLNSGSWGGSTNLILLSSYLTLISVSTWAFFQTDLKKIVALSTTSQLALMMIISILISPSLAFLHMTLHGFFKALIFMSSGASIHSNLSANQETIKNIPDPSNKIQASAFALGNLGLVGFPFAGAFFSKHMVLLNLSVSDLAFFFPLVLLISFILTLAYTIKILSLFTKNQSKSLVMGKEKGFFLSLVEVTPLFFLSILTMVSGVLISNYFYNTNFLSGKNEFFSSSFKIFFFLSMIFLMTSKNWSTLNFLSFYSIKVILSVSNLLKLISKLISETILEVSLLKKQLKQSFLPPMLLTSHKGKKYESGGIEFMEVFFKLIFSLSSLLAIFSLII